MSEIPTENVEGPTEDLEPTVPDTGEKVNSDDKQIEREDSGPDKAECVETMSKRQRKKLLKQKQWEEQRDMRRYGSNCDSSTW